MTVLFDLFELGMKRTLPIFKRWAVTGRCLNIGAGKQIVDGCITLDLPEFNANVMRIPYPDKSVDAIHCYHLLEHLSNPVFFLMECERVLVTGGIMNIVVPHYQSQLAYQDITHQRFFTLDTFRTLLNNDRYDTGVDGHHWQLKEIASIAIGILDRNLCIISQLEKQ